MIYFFSFIEMKFVFSTKLKNKYVNRTLKQHLLLILFLVILIPELFFVSSSGWREAFTCSPDSVRGQQVKGILGMTLCGGGWACWTGWLKPTRCGCCWGSVRRRPLVSCSNSRRGWGVLWSTCVSFKIKSRKDFTFGSFCVRGGAGVSGQEVGGSPEEGSFCSPGGGSDRTPHQPLPRPRDSVL